MSDDRSAVPLLVGLRVLELGDGVAGATATAVLRSLGATVTTHVVTGSALRRLEPRLPGPGGWSVLAAVLDDGKRVVDGDAGVTDLDDYDVVVADRVRGPVLGLPAEPADYVAQVARRPQGAWVTISAYGLEGSQAAWTGSELTVGAASGVLGAVRDPVTGRPLKLAGSQSLLAAGHAAALAALHAVDRTRRSGAAVHADVSAQEAAAAVGPTLQFALELLHAGQAGGARRFGAPAGMFPARDGVVRISAMEDHQWQGIAHALGRPDLAERYPTPRDRVDNAAEINVAIAELTSILGKVECEQRLQAAGVPCTAMYTTAEILALDQFEARGAFRPIGGDGGPSLRGLGPPFTLETEREAEGAPPSDRPAPTGLAGLRVLELGHVLAVPLAGALLGALGAHVVKAEDPERLDMYRRRPPYVDEIAGVNRAAYFSLVNHSKGSLSLDPERQPERLDDLLARADVVIENLGPNRARKTGVDAAALRRTRPHLLALSSSGFGHTGPWSGHRVYAYNLHTSCGLLYLTRTPDGGPAEIDMAWADLITGYALATVVAAWAVGPCAGRATAVDFSMAELVAGRFNEFVAAESAGLGGQPEDGTSRQRPYAPGGLLAVGDGWLAVGVSDDAQWAALRAALGHPPTLDDPAFATADGRWERRDELEAVLGPLVAAESGTDVAAHLQAAGVAASAVLDAAAVCADPTLEARGFFPSTTHPEWGPYRLIAHPWRILGDGPRTLAPPPVLGSLDESVAAGGDPFRGRPGGG